MSNNNSLHPEILFSFFEDGIICVAIDDEEVSELRFLMREHFVKQVGITVVRSNPAGRKTKGKFAPAHEYGLFYGNSESSIPQSLVKSEKSMSRYPKTDEKGRFSWANFIRSGNNDRREDRPKLFYPIFVKTDDTIRIPLIEWDAISQSYVILEEPSQDERVVYPIMVKEGKAIEKNWQRGHVRVRTELEEYRIRRTQNDKIDIDFKTRMDEESLPITWWDEKGYASANYGASELKELFSEKEFDFSKAKRLVLDSIMASGMKSDNTTALDYFAGSGTTGHAIIALNRQDQGKRKYILVEQGEYFDTVLKPRIQKVVYSAEWKDGKAIASLTGISHAFKVLKIKSYEDTLNNLQLLRTSKQQELLDSLPESAQEEYLLQYLLNIESRGSLLSVEHFRKPFDCKLKVAVDSAGAYEERTIDLVETFNYLIGLRVKLMEIAVDRGYTRVEGTLPSGESVLIIWRDCERIGYEELKRYTNRFDLDSRKETFDLIFINGDHNIPAIFTSTEAEGGITKKLNIRQIEPEFLSCMFSVEGV